MARDDFSDERRFAEALSVVQRCMFPKPEGVPAGMWVNVNRNMRARLTAFKLKPNRETFDMVMQGLDNSAEALNQIDPKLWLRVCSNRATADDVVTVAELCADILRPGELDKRLP